MTDARVVLVTVPSADKGAEIAREVVREGLAACANVIPGLRSIYVWDGAMQDDAEALVVFKTWADRLDALRVRVLALHPYEVPEFIALPVVMGARDYLAWLQSASRAPSSVTS